VGDLRIHDGQGRAVPYAQGKNRKDGDGFSALVKKAVERVSEMEKEADRSVEEMAKGNAGIHESMIALQKADISMRFLLQIRNKALEAYREIMRMQF
jgi:flagellar hook-basal body complex protein FliE